MTAMTAMTAILVTGKGTSGSWQIRGVQLGAALGARVVPMATEADCRRAQIVIGVKRIPQELAETIRRSGARFVWDCVDAWPQKAASPLTREQAIAWAHAELARLRPEFVIWPNERARDDIGRGGGVLRHHCMGEQPVNPIRERIATVGYHGASRYLDENLLRAINDACAAEDATFVMNPSSLAEVDVCLALRGAEWHASYPQRHWKPATKLTNAHATGTPWIGNSESGYKEIGTGFEVWVDDPRALKEALHSLQGLARRHAVHKTFVAARYSVERAAADLKAMLRAS